MNTPDTDVARLAAACRKELWPEKDWFRPDGYPNSLALCIIDAIQSTGSHYTSVRNVVSRYRAFRKDRGGDAANDGAVELLASFDACDGASGWAAAIGNKKPSSTKFGASLKAGVIREIAHRLDAAGIRTSDDLRMHGSLDTGNAARRGALKKLWTGVEAQSSGITLEYALMLAGVPGAKADRMVIRFVSDAIGESAPTPSRAAELVRNSAELLAVNATDLDHAIWRAQSGRPVHQGGS